MDELAVAVGGLRGALIVDVSRTLDVVEIGLRRGDDVLHLHVQCPFRILRGDTILLGSDDMRWLHPRATHAHLAFDRYETMFDASARTITAAWGDGLPLLDARLCSGGTLRLTGEGELRIEVFPAVSGPVECWRLITKGAAKDLVYPPGAA